MAIHFIKHIHFNKSFTKWMLSVSQYRTLPSPEASLVSLSSHYLPKVSTFIISIALNLLMFD